MRPLFSYVMELLQLASVRSLTLSQLVLIAGKSRFCIRIWTGMHDIMKYIGQCSGENGHRTQGMSLVNSRRKLESSSRQEHHETLVQ